MNDQDKIQPPVIEQLKEYARTYLKLAKYDAIDKAASVLGEFIADILQGICVLFIIMFASLTVAFYLAHLMHSLWLGFGSISVLYLVAFFALRIFKQGFKQRFVNTIARKLSKHLFNK